jgi:hypothetical protein
MDTFPILWPYRREEIRALEELGLPRSVPWSVVAPHEAQAKRNHDQSLKRLAERGGLSPSELLAVLKGEDLRSVWGRKDITAAPELLRLLAES